MHEYIIAYHGRKQPSSPEAGAKQMENWKNWIGGLGDAVVNPGTPLRMPKIVSNDGVADADVETCLTGISRVKAENMDAALEMAKACPFLEMGTLEVAEVMQM